MAAKAVKKDVKMSRKKAEVSGGLSELGAFGQFQFEGSSLGL